MRDLSRRQLLQVGICLAGSASLAMPSVGAPPAVERLGSDWPFLERYKDENADLLASGQPVDVIFMGDSITEGWLAKVPAFFTPGRVCRGIGGQTTPQMLVRFHQDVVRLRPRAVHVMAGTNDIAGNTGPSTHEMMQDNFSAMMEIATAHGIRLILASIPPAADFPWRPGLPTVGSIRACNAWLKGEARRIGCPYADYFAAMADRSGGMQEGLSYDHVHPTEQGYAVMQPVAEAAIAAVLAKRTFGAG
jgi:lysophospholipase L1-like esterase